MDYIRTCMEYMWLTSVLSTVIQGVHPPDTHFFKCMFLLYLKVYNTDSFMFRTVYNKSEWSNFTLLEFQQVIVRGDL
jgi:hypothetical protein